ncbi:MAG: hypothetical protein ACXW11_08100 [Methylotenera sp.]
MTPSHASILTYILQRITALLVVEAQDHQMKAPNRDTAIYHGKLQLNLPSEPHG